MRHMTIIKKSKRRSFCISRTPFVCKLDKQQVFVWPNQLAHLLEKRKYFGRRLKIVRAVPRTMLFMVIFEALVLFLYLLLTDNANEFDICSYFAHFAAPFNPRQPGVTLVMTLLGEIFRYKSISGRLSDQTNF